MCESQQNYYNDACGHKYIVPGGKDWYVVIIRGEKHPKFEANATH